MSEHHDCRKFFERLSELLDDEIDQATGDRIKAHVESCPECRACWATFKKTVEIYHAWGPDPVPQGFWDRLKKTVRDHQDETAEDAR